MGKLLVVAIRVLFLCTVVLALPAIAAAQLPTPSAQVWVDIRGYLDLSLSGL